MSIAVSLLCLLLALCVVPRSAGRSGGGSPARELYDRRLRQGPRD